jgi:hypothetical protein
MSNNAPDVLVKAFDNWLDAQRRAVEMICAVDQPGTPPDWAEGFRSVTRMASLALEHVVEKGDPAFPVLFKSQNPWSKLIGDNPDTNYYFCTIDPQYEYRLWGNKGNAAYVGLTVGTDIFRGTAPKGRTGTLAQAYLDQFECDDDGNFELTLSAKELPGNAIRLEPGSALLAVRETFPDRSIARPAILNLERISDAKPPELQPEILAERLEAAANHLIWIMTAVTGMGSMSGRNLNVIVGAHGRVAVKDQKREVNTHSDTDMYYQSGRWRLEPGQAWVVKILPPPNDYAYWGLVISNPWLESYDYFCTTTHITNETGVKNADGSMTIVVAQEDPGVPNWLDCGSRLEGYALLRWILAGEAVPDPECRLVSLADVQAGKI